MSSASPPTDLHYLLPPLLAEEEHLVDKLARVRAAIAALDPTRSANPSGDERAAKMSPAPSLKPESSAGPNVPEEFRGLSILQASLRHLSSAKTPTRTKEIASSLIRRGFPVASADLDRNISAAFREHSKKHPELIRVLGGAWAFRDWFTESELDTLLPSAHAEKTLDGIDVARKRGVRFGRPAAMNDEKMREAIRIAIADPNITVTDLARKLDVSPACFYMKFKGGFRSYARKLAAEQEQEQEQAPRIRVVK